jgi:hypothetical protein
MIMSRSVCSSSAASYRGERLIGIRADETDRADHQNPSVTPDSPYNFGGTTASEPRIEAFRTPAISASISGISFGFLKPRRRWVVVLDQRAGTTSNAVIKQNIPKSRR